MVEIDTVFVKIDRLISQSRLNELALMLNTSYAARVAGLATALGQLTPGAYLLGTGPSTAGIISLRSEEVVLGRTATPLEKPPELMVDYAITDTLYFVPQEVSRVHAKLVRRKKGKVPEYAILDLGSKCGLYVNGDRVEPEGQGRTLGHGDIISLGPSHVSTYVYYVAASKAQKPGRSEGSAGIG